MQKSNLLLEKLGKRSDLLVGIGIVIILIVLLVPLNPFIIDILLAVNMMLAFIILLAPIYLLRPSDFSVFPGILLVVTLYRLSLNVSTTRSILSKGEAGAIIDTFGHFIIGEQVFVGLIIFIILFIINFMVITKGSTRIAEVAARFTLDAMPGKQMAIDADLSNGVIDEDEARNRREGVRRDADFYGAMDGASKFVKGDAIAGLIITLINILGGFIVGMTAKNPLPWQQVLQKYTLLTVGDGLVAQIPALLISTSAGIIVTRSGTKANLGYEVMTQIFQEPKALYVAGAVIFMFGFVVGSRWYMFMSMGLLLATFGYYIQSSAKKTEKVEQEEKRQKELAEQTANEAPEDISNYLQVDALELEIGYSLITLIDENSGSDLLDRISSLRKQIAMEIGVVVPPIRIRDNIALVPNQYVIKIRGEEIGSAECLLNKLLALNPGTVEQPIEGISTIEPAFGLPAVWINDDKKDIAEMHGYTVIEPAVMIATHLSETIKTHSDLILTRQDVKGLLDNVKKENAAVVEELIDNNALSLGIIEQVIKNLLHEQVPVRDMTSILETLADYAPITKDVETLTEYCRFALARTIARKFTSNDGVVYGMALESTLEQSISEVVSQIKSKNYAASLQPNTVNNFYQNLSKGAAEMKNQGLTPLLLVSPLIRAYTKKLTEPALADLAVISYSEIPTSIPINAQIIVSGNNEERNS